MPPKFPYMSESSFPESNNGDHPSPTLEGQTINDELGKENAQQSLLPPTRPNNRPQQFFPQSPSSTFSEQQGFFGREKLELNDPADNHPFQSPPFPLEASLAGLPETRIRGDSIVIEMPPFFKSNFFTGKDGPKGPTNHTEYHRALRYWKSINNLDKFLEQVYQYYQGRGFRVILLRRLSNLFTIGFVLMFSIVLAYCVDWTFIHRHYQHFSASIPPSTIINSNPKATLTEHPKLWEIVNIFGGLGKIPILMWLCLVAFAVIWIWQLILIIQDIPRLQIMNRFYTCVLGLADYELATCEFGDVIRRLVKLQEDYPISMDRLNAYDVANRIMRRENYLIAMFNKEILDLSFPIPLIKRSNVLTKVMEWNLSFCILNYVFDENHMIRRNFVKDVQRDKLINDLRRRFQMMAILNAVLAPFVLIFMLIYTFFRYAEEIYSDPKTIGTRQYTLYARWKFREFNELPHQFDRRLANSNRKAYRYMSQFHQDMVAGLAKLVGFVASSFLAVLLIVSIANEDLLMHFELTPGRSIIWWIGILGAIVAVSRALTPDQTQISDPERLMNEVAEYTHYLPSHWRKRPYSERVHSEFGEFFEYRTIIVAQELASVIYTPWALWNVLPQSAPRLIEFFREFSVHVDGMGYVCSFALFDFKRHGNLKYGSVVTNQAPPVDKYHRTKQGKMEKSFLNFVANNPDWTPDVLGSMYLEKISEENNEHYLNFDQAANPALNKAPIQPLEHLANHPPKFRFEKNSVPSLSPRELADDEQLDDNNNTTHNNNFVNNNTTHNHLVAGQGIISVLNKVRTRSLGND